MTRRRGLDGLRGVALLGMLAWHAEVGWIRGGFARMTIFFALSGFLATRSYLRLTGDGDGAASRLAWMRSVRAFAARRARRLLPVTLLGLALATAVTVAAGTTDMRRALAGDVASVVAAASNWRFLFADRAYGALFERPSAFQHLWSLSLEEQCLIALPLVLAVALRWDRRWAPLLTAALGTALAAVPAFVAHAPDAAYYGTHVRAGELLAGVTLALVLDRWGGSVPESWRRRVQGAGITGLVGLGVVMVAVDRDLPWLYRGGLGLFALPAVAVIAAASERDGPVPHLLGARPLAAVGRAAFPIYTLHWPLFVLARRRFGPDGGAALVAAELVVALAVGLVVHELVERPLLAGPPREDEPAPQVAGAGRRPIGPLARLRLTDRAVIGGAVAGLGLLVIAAVAVPTPPPAYDFAAAEQRANAGGGARPGDDRPGIALFGGSTGVALGTVAIDWADRHVAPVRVTSGSTQLGCGLVTEGRRLAPRPGEPLGARAPDEYCRDWEQRWRTAADDGAISVAVLFGGVWETSDWELDGHDGWTDLTDPAFADLVRAKLNEAAAILSDGGRQALLATTPEVGPGESGRVPAERGLRPDHRQRIDIYNALVREVAAGQDRVGVLEYGELVDALDPTTSAEWLPDGVHPTEPAARAIWDELIGPAVIAAATPPADPLLVAGPPATNP